MKINSLSKINFKGVYLARNFEPNSQYTLACEIAKSLRESGESDKYEKQGKDLLVIPIDDNLVGVKVKKAKISRLTDDNYSRWSGRF
ncbi:MAG: hypothetical protein IJ877_03590 [Candidatus Gastranaerophilales bacterium]|nr:hypothetical protein [Candidatus Gastranaerophilales bacterium]